jgi:hypothetical protein
MELAMDGIIQADIVQANIDRFKQLLKTETDPMKRAMEMRLLTEEEAKLTQPTNAGKKEAIGS